MEHDPAKVEWVRRVLGITIGNGGADEGDEVVGALNIAERAWQGALDRALANARPIVADLMESHPTAASSLHMILSDTWREFADAIRAARSRSGEAASLKEAAQAHRDAIMSHDMLSYFETNGLPLRLPFVTALDRILRLAGE